MIEIKGFNCLDHDPIQNWQPKDKDDVEIYMNFTIGPVSSMGGDNFQAYIITKKRFLELNEKDGRYIVLNEYSFENVFKQIDCIIKKCENEDWPVTANNLKEYFYWEYENYRQ
jgi:hypothetical protein